MNPFSKVSDQYVADEKFQNFGIFENCLPREPKGNVDLDVLAVLRGLGQRPRPVMADLRPRGAFTCIVGIA